MRALPLSTFAATPEFAALAAAKAARPSNDNAVRLARPHGAFRCNALALAQEHDRDVLRLVAEAHSLAGV